MTTKQELYDHLKNHLIEPGPTDSEGRIWSYCPAHNDGQKNGRKPTTKHGPDGGRSLSLHPRIGVNCFADCDFERILAAFPPMERPVAAGAHQWAEVARYEYKDMSGRLIAIKRRLERPEADGQRSKSFRWQDPEGNSGLSFPMNTIPLWGAELIKDIPLDEWIYFCEGEKATQACRDAGLYAVCAGVGATKSPDLANALADLLGRKVALWPDNDEIGRAYMSAVKSLLMPIAGEVKTVKAPVGPKEDAYDFFKLGGTVATLESGEIAAPTTTVLGEDRFEFKIPIDLERVVTFLAADVAYTKRNIDIKLTVSGVGGTVRPRRINVLSESAIEGLVRSLGKSHGTDIPWQRLVDQFVGLLDGANNSHDPTVDVLDIEAPEAQEFLVQDFLPKGEESVIFGPGGAGKTYQALDLAYAVATGTDSCGRRAEAGSVLWLDYETNERTFRYRIKRLTEGKPVGLSSKRMFYWRPNAPLAYIAEALQRKVEEAAIQFIVVDSAGKAAGGDLREQPVVQELFSNLRRFGVTSLVLAHVTKDGDPDTPFGSIYMKNEPHGRVWYLYRSDDSTQDENLIGMVCKKASDGEEPSSVAISHKFPVTSSAIIVGNAAAGRISDLTIKTTSPIDRVKKALRGGQEKALDLLAVEADLRKDYMERLLRDHRFDFEETPGGEWKLRSR